MSHTSPYHQQPNLPQQQQDQHAQAPAGLSPAFLASLQSLYPSVSPTSKTAQDIAAYLNGTASISYESRLDSGFQQQMNANVAPPQSLVQARAIETLLAQAKHAQQHAVSPSSPQGSYPTYALSSSPYFTDNSAPIQRGGGGGGGGNVQPSLFNQQPIQPPSLPFNLFPYQQYLQQHQQRFQPQYTNFSNFQQQHQQSTQYQTPFYPPLPFLAAGEQQHSQYNTEINSSSSTNSTVESPSLPELGQDFIYDPSFDLSGASNDFEDANVSPFGAQLANGGYEFYKSAQGGGGHALVQQQQQPFDMASLDTDSPLTSSSPSSSFAPPSPYAFNNVAESSFSNSESEYDFQSCSVSVVGSTKERSVSSSTTTVGPGGEVEKKKHVCEVCHRGFARAFNLKSHMHTHAPNRYKPFLCPSKDCSRSFSRSHDMERHRSGIHQEGPLAAKAGLIPEDSPAAAPGIKASTKKRSARGVTGI